MIETTRDYYRLTETIETEVETYRATTDYYRLTETSRDYRDYYRDCRD